MRTYEALYIIRPDLRDDEIQTVATEVEQYVVDNGGTIVRSETWGKRRLAYEVNGFHEGCYVLLRFEAKPAFIAKLELYFKISERIIRDLVVLFDATTLRLEAEQKRRTEEEIKATAAARARREAEGDDDDDEDEGRGYRRGRGDRDRDRDDED